MSRVRSKLAKLFQLTAARRRLVAVKGVFVKIIKRFNSQPPEGGWQGGGQIATHRSSFNSQPPEGGWQNSNRVCLKHEVSTHSRPKAAGPNLKSSILYNKFQLTAARRRLGQL